MDFAPAAADALARAATRARFAALVVLPAFRAAALGFFFGAVARLGAAAFRAAGFAATRPFFVGVSLRAPFFAFFLAAMSGALVRLVATGAGELRSADAHRALVGCDAVRRRLAGERALAELGIAVVGAADRVRLARERERAGRRHCAGAGGSRRRRGRGGGGGRGRRVRGRRGVRRGLGRVRRLRRRVARGLRVVGLLPVPGRVPGRRIRAVGRRARRGCGGLVGRRVFASRDGDAGRHDEQSENESAHGEIQAQIAARWPRLRRRGSRSGSGSSRRRRRHGPGRGRARARGVLVHDRPGRLDVAFGVDDGGAVHRGGRQRGRRREGRAALAGLPPVARRIPEPPVRPAREGPRRIHGARRWLHPAPREPPPATAMPAPLAVDPHRPVRGPSRDHLDPGRRRRTLDLRHRARRLLRVVGVGDQRPAGRRDHDEAGSERDTHPRPIEARTIAPRLMRTSTPLALLAAATLGAASTACAKVPEGRSAVDAVDVVGAHALDSADVADKLATTASPRFLGLARGFLYDYEIFDASMLQRDLARVERLYRGHGFFEAHARAGRVVQVSPGHVRVEILVEEGPPTVARAVRIEGLEGLPPQIADGVRSAARALSPGDRFDEEKYAKAKDAVARAMTDEGYAYATVGSDAQVDFVAHAVDYTFTVKPGPSCVLGPVTIVIENEGTNGPTVEEPPLRRTLHLIPGRTYSTADIDTATQALLDLEVLSSVDIKAKLSDPPQSVVPLEVRVQPSKLRALRLGGGLEFDEIKTDVHGIVGWEHHNFLGNLRDFSVDFKPGVVLYPTRISNPIVAPSAYLPEERLRLQLRQPACIDQQTACFMRPEFNVFPMLVSPNPPSGQTVLGYVEPKGTIGLDRRFGKHAFVTVGHNLQGEVPFAYKFAGPDLSSPLPAVLLSVIQLQGSLDFRDDRVHPHAGAYFSSDLQFGGGPLLGSANDIRWQPDVRAYVPIARGITLAARSSVGMLFASNYGAYIHSQLPTPLPRPTQAPDLYETVDRDIEITLFRGFFSGGPSSNRGYPVRGIAPHGVVPFLSPATQQSLVGTACAAGDFSDACRVPIGGFTLWEASVELRFAFNGPLGFALFCDSGDVAAKEVEFRFNHLHLSCGAGARLDTPVGPIRLDVGYRMPFAQVLPFQTEGEAAAHDPTEGSQPWLFGFAGHPGVPMAISFGIGETY